MKLYLNSCAGKLFTAKGAKDAKSKRDLERIPFAVFASVAVKLLAVTVYRKGREGRQVEKEIWN
jgi:hypothetical protein